MEEKAPEKKKLGRPLSFSDRLAETALQLAAEGKTDEEIAKALGIATSTFYVWKGNASFSDALKEAKSIADELVEASLFRRATGYKMKAIKFFCYEGCIVSEKYTQHFAPDVTACIFWLKNRKPKQWRDVNKDDGNNTNMPQIIVNIPSNGREATIESKPNGENGSDEKNS